MSHKAQNEGRLLLALNAYNNNEFRSVRQAAIAYNIPPTSLLDRVNGRVSRLQLRANNHKLNITEEETLEQWILSIDDRGHALTVGGVRDAALLLLQQRVGESASIGVNWGSTFVKRTPALNTRYTRKYDYKRALCEDPELIGGWFRLVHNITAKYGIQIEDIYNFDETGFAMGVASTSRVVTASDRRGKPHQLQSGDREWVTSIEAINATGWSLPPMVIFKAKVHLSTWYANNNVPADWTIALSDNGWSSNELGYKWLTEVFEPNTLHRTVGSHRLLILDGHGSHVTPQFDLFCKEHLIITLCMPPHSSHLLQPLDVGCFSALKRSYGAEVSSLLRLGVNHVDKADFLHLLRIARNKALSAQNIIQSFAATGLVPFDPDQVLATLSIRPYTPPETTATEVDQWQPETPHNLAQLEHQMTAVRGYLKRRSKSPPSPTDMALNQLLKGCQMAMQSSVLLAAENSRLRAANTRVRKKRMIRKKFISSATVLTVDTAVNMTTASSRAVVVPNQPVDEEPPKTVTVPEQAVYSGPTCFICRGFDHYAMDCTKYK